VRQAAAATLQRIEMLQRIGNKCRRRRISCVGNDQHGPRGQGPRRTDYPGRRVDAAAQSSAIEIMSSARSLLRWYVAQQITKGVM